MLVQYSGATRMTTKAHKGRGAVSSQPGRFAKQLIEDTVAEMETEGVRHAVALVLAPHYSSMSIAKYFAKLDAALAEGPSYVALPPIASLPPHTTR